MKFFILFALFLNGALAQLSFLTGGGNCLQGQQLENYCASKCNGGTISTTNTVGSLGSSLGGLTSSLGGLLSGTVNAAANTAGALGGAVVGGTLGAVSGAATGVLNGVGSLTNVLGSFGSLGSGLDVLGIGNTDSNVVTVGSGVAAPTVTTTVTQTQPGSTSTVINRPPTTSSVVTTQTVPQQGTFEFKILAFHNVLRRFHQANPLSWSVDAARIALEWAKQLAASGTLSHNANRGTYGENIFFHNSVDKPEDAYINAAVSGWYNERRLYSQGQDFTNGIGHFTQVVWKGTSQVGCGMVKDAGKGTFIVCNYSPAGNIRGQFNTNVFCGNYCGANAPNPF